MFVLTQTAKAIEGNTDPYITAALFITAIASVALLCFALLQPVIEHHNQKTAERKRKQKEESEQTWHVVDRD